MKFNNKICLFLLACGLLACESQEPELGRTPEEIRELELQTIRTITGENNPVIWKISRAILKNKNGEFDISQNFNVLDDEFVFSASANSQPQSNNLIWKRRNLVNLKANSILDAVQEYNHGVTSYNFNIIVEDEIEISVPNSPISFYMKGEEIHGTLRFPQEEAQISVILSDYTEAELTGNIQELTFTEFSSIETGNMGGHSPAFIASHKNQALYFVGREDIAGGNPIPQRIIKFNSLTGERTEIFDASHFDAVTKGAAVIKDKLHVFGASFYSLYDLNLNSLQPWTRHGDPNTRFGIAPLGDQLLVYGISPISTHEMSHTIKGYNPMTNSFADHGEYENMRTDVRGVLIDDILHIYGGVQKWGDLYTNNNITIFDLKQKTSKRIVAPINMRRTYSGYKNNLVFFMGLTSASNDKIVLYDVNTENFSVINTNLRELQTNGYAHGMAVLDSKLYVIFGVDNSAQSPQSFKIFRADLP